MRIVTYKSKDNRKERKGCTMILKFGLVFKGRCSGKEFFIPGNVPPQKLEEVASKLTSEFENGEEEFEVSLLFESVDYTVGWDIGETESYANYLDKNVELDERLTYESWAKSVIMQKILEVFYSIELMKMELDWFEYIMSPLICALPK
jgi:hypothetical protein